LNESLRNLKQVFKESWTSLQGILDKSLKNFGQVFEGS
jgi:hypothetical protein